MKYPKLMLITDKGVQEFFPKSTLEEMLSNQQKKSLQHNGGVIKTGEDPPIKKLYTMAQVTKLFATSRPTIYAWIKKELLHPVTIGGRVYFRPVDIDQLIDDRTKES